MAAGKSTGANTQHADSKRFDLLPPARSPPWGFAEQKAEEDDGWDEEEEEEDWFTYFAEDDETCTMIVYVCWAWIRSLRTMAYACVCILPCGTTNTHLLGITLC